MTEKIFNYKELLKPINMLNLYAQGAFPMAEDDGIINWYQPKTRAIIPLEDFNVPRSLKKFMQKSDFEFSFDIDVMEVVKNCSKRNETWISKELISAYSRIHDLGFLHSVEVYQKAELIGGLYGVAIGGAFFGESMFSKKSQASKTALVKLIERLNEKEFTFLDVQFTTPHLEMFGTKEIDFEEYNNLLDIAFSKNINFI